MFADVIVDINHTEVDKIFEYRVDGLSAKVGSRLRVPFGNKAIEGIVIALKENAQYNEEKVKSAFKVLEEIPALTQETLSLSDYVSKTCYCTRANSLRLFLPSEMRKGRIKERFEKFAWLSFPERIETDVNSLRKSASKQRDLLYFLLENGKSKLSYLAELFGYSAVNSLEKKGLINFTEEKFFRSP
ncbi:MAG: hypothetical protein IKA99_06655, partial [Clostridia bacterium]|nr:hypothetical protein [Clostridia bacterium]